MNKPDKQAAIAYYILSRRQGVDMIASLSGKPEAEVNRLIKIGGRLVEQQEASDGVDEISPHQSSEEV